MPPAFAQGSLIWEETFTSDGPLRAGGNWWGNTPIWTGQAGLQVVSGLVATGQADGVYADAWALPEGQEARNVDIVLEDISGKPGTNRQVYLHARLIPQAFGNPIGNPDGATSYSANFTTLSGTDRWRLAKQVNGAFTALGTGGQVNSEEAGGFGMGMRVNGATQELYRQAGVGGAWAQILTAADGAISDTMTDAIYVGLECNASAFRAGRIAVYSLADTGDVETSGSVASSAVLSARSSVFFPAALTSIAVLGHVSAVFGVVATTGAVTSVAVLSAVSDTPSPIGDATSRGVITGVSALVGNQTVVSAGQVVSTGVVSTVGVIVTTGVVTSMAVLSAVNGTPGTIATQGLVVTVAEVSGVSSPVGRIDTFATVTSAGVVDGVTSLNPIRTTGSVVSVGVGSGVTSADSGLIAAIEGTLLLLSTAIVAREAAIAAARITAPRTDDARAAFALGAGRRAYRETERALSLARRLS